MANVASPQTRVRGYSPRMRLAVTPLVATASLCTSLHATPCRADEPRSDVALLAGAATMTLPLVAGSTLIAQGDDLHVRNLGVGVAEGGLVLAPLVTHAVLGETRRGLAFAAVPAAFATGTATLLLFVPNTIDGGKLHIQYTFAALFIGSFLGATIGVVDGLYAGGRAVDRARDRTAAGDRTKLTVFPTFARDHVGIALGGWL